MYKIGVLGDYDSIKGFAVLGFDIYPVKNSGEARTRLMKLAEQSYAVIYITEQYMADMNDLFEKYRQRQTPAITVIPSGSKSALTGRNIMKKYVERAVGSDVIYNEK